MNRSIWRRGIVITLTTAAAVGVAASWRDEPPYVPPIEPRGGEPMRMELGPMPLHLQTDPRWKDETLGGSGEPFGATGCVVCGVSMALAHFGMNIPPDSLNHLLKEHEGYTRQGWIKWDAVADLTDGRVRIDASEPLTHAAIDSALLLGSPVLAMVLIGGTVSHWVLIAGKDGLDYLMKDPLGTGDHLEAIGRYGRIHAIRVFRAGE
jgi:hypothetical protein